VRVLREEGGRTLVAKVLGETVYRRLALVERDLRAELPPPRDVPGLSCGWLDASGLDAYEALRPGEREQAAKRFAAGQRCFGTWLGDRLAAVRWVGTGAPLVEYLGIRLPLAPGDVYHYDTFTDPTLRRRGISAATQERLFEVLRGEGYERAVRAILPENHAAVRDAAATGFEPCGKIGFVRVGPWRHEFVRRRRTARLVEPERRLRRL
jgi:GNAT superfamily N-acetyltransferase